MVEGKAKLSKYIIKGFQVGSSKQEEDIAYFVSYMYEGAGNLSVGSRKKTFYVSCLKWMWRHSSKVHICTIKN